MILRSITIEGFLCFRDRFHLVLDARAYAVVARYATEPDRSNWAGKTAFLQAIEWGFAGSIRAGKRYDDDIIHTAAESTRVALDFGDWSLERTRRRGHSSSLVVTVGDATYAKGDAEAKIVELMGFDFEDWRHTLGFAQGDVEAIVDQTNGERRTVVARWLDLDVWLRVSARARAANSKMLAQCRDLVAELRIRRAELESLAPVSDVEIYGAHQTLEGATRRLADIDRRLERVARVEIARQDRIRFDALQPEMEELRLALTGAGISAEVLEAAQNQAATDRAAEEAAERVFAEADTRARHGFDGVCPVTANRCPVEADIRADRLTAEARRREAREAHVGAMQTAHKSSQEARRLEARSREVARLRERYASIQEERRRLHRAISERSGTEVSDEDVAALKTERDRAQKIVNEATIRIRELEAATQRRLEVAAWIESKAGEVAEAEAELAALHFAVRATGSTGIPALIAESSLSTLERRANGLLEGSGLSFEFAWERDTKKLAPVCEGCGYVYKGQRDKSCPVCDSKREPKRSDELEILVHDGGLVEDVRAKSGGARVLVAAAIRLAAGLMLRERRGARCAWAQVDEPFGSLDARNRVALARTFSGMLSSVGLEQAFLVSHDAALLDVFPGRIEVVRHDDYSTLEVLR